MALLNDFGGKGENIQRYDKYNVKEHNTPNGLWLYPKSTPQQSWSYRGTFSVPREYNSLEGPVTHQAP